MNKGFVQLKYSSLISLGLSRCLGIEVRWGEVS